MAYPQRHTVPTRSLILARRGDLAGALEAIESGIESAEASGDQLLRKLALLTKAELLDEAGAASELATILDGAIVDLNSYPDLHAHYERVLACALAADGDSYAARTHFDRAKRIYDSLGHVPGLLELNRRWDRATTHFADRAALAPDAPAPHTEDPSARARIAVQTAAALTLHAGRPELLAREIVELLAATGCVRGAAVVARDADGLVETLAAFGDPLAVDGPPDAVKRIAVGIARERTIELLTAHGAGVDAVATLNAVTLLLAPSTTSNARAPSAKNASPSGRSTTSHSTMADRRSSPARCAS